MPKSHRDTKEDRAQTIAITLVTCFVYWLFGLTANSWGPLLAPLATQLQLSLDKIGLLLVAWSLGYLVGALIAGPLLDKYGTRLAFFVAVLLILSGLSALFLGVLL